MFDRHINRYQIIITYYGCETWTIKVQNESIVFFYFNDSLKIQWSSKLEATDLLWIGGGGRMLSALNRTKNGFKKKKKILRNRRHARWKRYTIVSTTRWRISGLFATETISVHFKMNQTSDTPDTLIFNIQVQDTRHWYASQVILIHGTLDTFYVRRIWKPTKYYQWTRAKINFSCDCLKNTHFYTVRLLFYRTYATVRNASIPKMNFLRVRVRWNAKKLYGYGTYVLTIWNWTFLTLDRFDIIAKTNKWKINNTIKID